MYVASGQTIMEYDAVDGSLQQYWNIGGPEGYVRRPPMSNWLYYFSARTDLEGNEFRDIFVTAVDLTG